MSFWQTRNIGPSSCGLESGVDWGVRESKAGSRGGEAERKPKLTDEAGNVGL